MKTLRAKQSFQICFDIYVFKNAAVGLNNLRCCSSEAAFYCINDGKTLTFLSEAN